jgi:Ca-activated chloride channel family protein
MNVTIATSTLVLAALFESLGGPAHRKTATGNRHYDAGDLERALAAYTEAQVDAPDAAELHYDIGNVLYRQADFEGAVEAFERALASAGPALRADAAFNLGNARYRQKEFAEAVEAYRRALEARPADGDAKRNLELALRALEAQSRQEPEKQDGEQKPEPQPPPSPAPSDAGQPSPDPSPKPQPSPGGGAGPSPSPRPADGSMTPDQAERLLDGAADAEREARQDEAARAASRAGDARREKDW